jgi:hypothetical protein
VGGRRNKRKLDNRPPCAHCHKPGHSIDSCWEKYPDKRGLIMREAELLRNLCYLLLILPPSLLKPCFLTPLIMFFLRLTRRIDNLGGCVNYARR